MISRTVCFKLLLLPALALPLLAHAVPRYTVTFLLGELSVVNSVATGIANGGNVSATSFHHEGLARAVSYTGGAMRDLGTLGGTFSFSHGINAAGTSVGTSEIANAAGYHAFREVGNGMVDLGTLGGRDSWGYAINSGGTVVGMADLADGQSHHAFMESGKGLVDLGTLGGSSSSAGGVNDAGSVVGGSSIAGDQVEHAFLYQNGVMSDLGSLGGASIYASGINNAGNVIGWGQAAGSDFFHAFTRSGNGLLDLGSLDGTNSQAYGQNNAGQIVGASGMYPSDERGFLYSGGVMRDLNSLIAPTDDYKVGRASGINDQGQIIAEACDHSYVCSVVRLDLIPAAVPEPETYGLLLAGLALLGGIARRKSPVRA